MFHLEERGGFVSSLAKSNEAFLLVFPHRHHHLYQIGFVCVTPQGLQQSSVLMTSDDNLCVCVYSQMVGDATFIKEAARYDHAYQSTK